MICDCDFDPNICETLHYPKARKTHCCDHCGGTIKRGERYRKFQGLDCDKKSFSDKMCADCEFWLNECGRTLGDGCNPCWYLGSMTETWSMFIDSIFIEQCKSELERLAGMFNAHATARGGSIKLDLPF